jgi:hypothetical protein
MFKQVLLEVKENGNRIDTREADTTLAGLSDHYSPHGL